VKRSEAQLTAAQDFIEELVAQGRTNISGALAKAVTSEAAEGRPHITIFLTDGTPTAGELVPEKIVESVTATQTCPTRIFVMGVGHDVNTHLLDKLAEATDGSSEYVTADDEIDAKIATLYDRLSHPVLTNVVVDCGELRTHSVYPKKIPALFKGSEFMLFGRYREGGKHTFTVSGSLSGQSTRYACQADLPSDPSADTTAFVAPLWAARKIGYLLQEIRLHGENDELITEVVRLSKKFGIVTEYTEFIASVTGDISAELAVSEARQRMNMANAVQAGQWAFNQARNDRQLQQKVVATNRANFYLDRQGRRVATENIQQFDDNVFYLRDGQWVDGQDQGDRKTRTVKLFSKEYNDLVRNNRRFAQAQRLGWAMSINVGEERIVVENDGETQSEELLERVRQQQQPAVDQQQQMRNLQFNNRFNQLRQQQIPVNQLPNIQVNQQLQLNNRNVQEVQQQEPARNNDR
jgi:Ca-activated chloride channel family protein